MEEKKQMKKIGILESENFSTLVLHNLSKYFQIEFYDEKCTLKTFIEDKSVIFVRLKYQITAELIQNSMIEFICSPTTGLNHIDKSLHNKVICLKNEFEFLDTIRATPEHSFGLAVALLRNYKDAFLSIYNTEWNREKYKGFELYQNTIGIIGFGRVGKLLCQYYTAFGAKVYYYDIDSTIQSKIATCCISIEDVISKSNIIHLCANYTDENREMIDAKYFHLMEKKYFINTARGELINEDDLLDFISKGKFKGIAIDVISTETSQSNIADKLIQLSVDKNLIITPHISGATYTSMCRTEEFICQKLLEKLNYIEGS